MRDICAIYTKLNPRTWLDVFRPMPTGRGMVIITGMQKSGTTAIAMLLGAAAGQTVCSDPFYILSWKNVNFGKELYERQVSLRTLWKRHKRIFFGNIIKDPDFSLLLPQIRDMLPDAQIVFIVRDPRDTIRSVLNRLNLPGKSQGVDLFSYDIPPLWMDILLGKYPEVRGADYVEVLAQRWRLSAEAFLEHRNSCIMIRYEDFKKNKSEAIFKLAKQLGYSEFHSIECLLDVQYQPKGNTAVSWNEFFGETQLGVIERVTAPLLKEFGYTMQDSHSQPRT